MKKCLITLLLLATVPGFSDTWCITCNDDRVSCAHVLGNTDPWQFCGSKDLDIGCRHYEFRMEWCLLADPPVQDKVVNSSVNYAEYCIGEEDCH